MPMGSAGGASGQFQSPLRNERRRPSPGCAPLRGFASGYPTHLRWVPGGWTSSRSLGLLWWLALTVSFTGCRLRAPASIAAGSPGPVARSGAPILTEELPRLPFRHVNGGRRPINILQTIGACCALLDYNGDGKLDLFLV